MRNIVCKIFGHKIKELNTSRMYAVCGRCDKGLKVAYDMLYGETVVYGDYGNQTSFCWCKCGNELMHNSIVEEKEHTTLLTCKKCGLINEYDLDAPAPLFIRTMSIK
jgi:hypothetical protein